MSSNYREAINKTVCEDLKVALIHSSISWKDKDKNIAKLLALNEEAAQKGSRIIVNTELATTGYAFESRKEIAPLAESIPGPTTEAFGRIAEEYGRYICIGMPERDSRTGIFYNSAALLGPMGVLWPDTASCLRPSGKIYRLSASSSFLVCRRQLILRPQPCSSALSLLMWRPM